MADFCFGFGWTGQCLGFSVRAIEQSATVSEDAKRRTATARPSASPRAAASIVFACVALFLWRIYGQVHWVTQGRVFGNVKEQLAFVDRELVLAYFILAGMAAIWCIWSWLTESRIGAVVATVFTLIAVRCCTIASVSSK